MANSSLSKEEIIPSSLISNFLVGWLFPGKPDLLRLLCHCLMELFFIFQRSTWTGNWEIFEKGFKKHCRLLICLLFCIPGRNAKPRKVSKFNFSFKDPLWVIIRMNYLHACGKALWPMKVGSKTDLWLVFEDKSHKAKT